MSDSALPESTFFAKDIPQEKWLDEMDNLCTRLKTEHAISDVQVGMEVEFALQHDWQNGH